MIPSRSTRSSSRRSSILKPPKPRLPLQSLNFNNSSSDNSPATTTKIKRRVSFAEKKHVKEFCNSVEQGTVWDNTYEEHDVSSLKTSSNEGSGDVQSVFKENILTTEFHNEIVYINSENVDTYSTQVSNMQFVSNEIIQNDLNVEDHDMNFTNTVDNTECPHTLSIQEEILLSPSSIVFHSTVKQKNESMFGTNVQVNSNTHIHKNITVYEEPDRTTSNKVLNSQQSNINNVNCNDMNVTSVQNTHTTLSETVCNTLHIDTNHIQNNKLEDTLKSTSMELTKAVPTSMNICRSISQSTNNVFQGQNTKKGNTKVEKAVDHVFDPIDNFHNGELVAKDFDNVSMEMTAAVSTLHRVDCDPNSVSYNNDKGITIFHDTSIEMIKPVSPITDINMMCKNETSQVPQYKHDIMCTSEKTMEITKAVPINIHSGTTHNFEKLGYNINPDKANIDNTLCIDEEMEFTTALTPVLQVPSSNLNNDDSVCNTPYMHWNSHNSILNNSENDHTNSLSDKTKIFHNKSVTTTAVVLPVSLADVCEKEMVNGETKLNKHESGRTVLFPNMSMEITEAGPLLQNNLRTNNSVVGCSDQRQLVSSKIYEDKTLLNKMVDCETNLNKQESSKTVLFPNMSMEITEAVSLLQDNHPTRNSVVNFAEVEQLVSSEIFEDKTLSNKMVDCETNLYKQESSKTVLFPNMSMEITEAVSLLQDNHPTRNSVVNFAEVEQLVSSEIFEDKTLSNKMVDCETNLNKQESSRTALFANMSMEITEAVSLLQNNHPTGNSVENSTEVEQLVSSEKYENKNLCNNSLNQTTTPDNVLKDITPLVIPSSLNLKVCLEEENCVTANSKNLKECFSNEPPLNKVINSVNSRISVTLHGSIEENICASALEENNTQTACTPLHAASYNPSCAASSKMNQSNCLQIEHSQDIISHSRRTYVIKPCIDHSLINNSKENIKISEVNNVIQNKEISLTFFNESLEELESIKPPSFIGLDDSLDESVNVDTKTPDLLKSLNRSKVIESAVQNNQVDKSKIFLNECTPLDDKPVSSNVEHKDQAQISEIQKLQLSFMNITNTELLMPDCSLPSTTSTKRTLIFGEEKSEDLNSQDVCTDICNVEDHNMECFSLKKNDIHEETSKIEVENNYLCNDTSKLCNDQNILTATSTDFRETMESHESSIKNDISIELNPFSLLVKELRVCARSNEIIWDVYHENIERKMFIIGFISCSLLVVIFLGDDCNTTNVQLIKDIKIISRLADDADVFISIVHRIIIQKLCTAKLIDIYRNNENILPMLEYISKEVKLAMDFMFDLKHLYNLNLMEITRDSISFVSLTKKMEIILKITVNVKPFEKIEFQDISVHCLLGSVREEDIKKLITNIKRDHRFFRRYMSDVKDYIYVMEDSCILNTIPR